MDTPKISPASLPETEMEEIQEKLLNLLNESGSFDSLKASNPLGLDHQKVVGGIKSLQSIGNLIEAQQVTQFKLELTPEGAGVAKDGSYEANVFNSLKAEGSLQSEIMKTVNNAKIGVSKALSKGWVRIEKGSGGPVLLRKVDSIEDTTQQSCQKIASGNASDISDEQKTELKKRKLLLESKIVSYLVTKGSNFSLQIDKLETDLTQDLLNNGAWRTKNFKAYNFNALGQRIDCGHLHPLLKVRTQFRQILLEMGFCEMPSNRFVESSFWNFDALFQPQQHPARDAHDTFFVSRPETSDNFPREYMERVKTVHSEGGYGSQGYGYNWKESEAAKNLMRTHTTAVSARMLYKIAQQKEFKPAKLFSIDRVFRNENLDATHLAEFHQFEGLVADRNLSLGHLIGMLHEFLRKLGIEKLRFKPAYNPYTEPSMEVFSYHEGLKKWVEVGNSGIFRPEMLLPMGLPPDVSVIAWGLSLERPTMVKYGINNIRDLFGPKVDLQMIYDSPMCRLDKNPNTQANA